MNNEIGRKLTSLTLMTIMLASAFAAGAPSVLPSAAAANANLFVSAENSQFQNYIAGPMVTEVVVIDSDIKDTDKGKGEPDVTVNGNKLRMAQATDGNWYGYFADRAQAQIADATASSSIGGTGLDFGSFCKNDSTAFGPTFTQTVGFAVATNATGGTNGESTLTTCTAVSAVASDTNNVVRENKTLNRGGTGVTIGQIGFTGMGASKAWPIIQLYDFNPTGNVVVQYNKGGGVQSTTLKFDTVDQFAKLDLDRTSYPDSAQVHATITDLQLNVDPTDEDSWTFGTKQTNSTVFYQLFDENGIVAGDGRVTSSIVGNLTRMMFEDNGVLKLNVAQDGSTVLQIQDNADSRIINGGNAANARTSSVGTGDQPVVITESGPNTGVFGTYDESDVSNLAITSTAPRGKSASIDYNATPKSIVVGFGFASVDIQPADVEWNSGEEIPVVITDSDANKNSRADEDLDLNNGDVSLIPSLRVGTPFTLGNNGTETANSIRAMTAKAFALSAVVGGSELKFTTAGQQAGNQFVHSATVQKFSDRAILSENTNKTLSFTALTVQYGKTVTDLKKVVYGTNSTASPRLHGFNFFNYDVRGLSNSTITNVDTYLAFTNQTNLVPASDTVRQSFRVISMSNNTASQGLINLNQTSGSDTTVVKRLYGLSGTNPVGVVFTFDAAQVNTGKSVPIVADFFSFGYLNDGIVKSDRVNNEIIRIEAEETGDNTSIFSGTLEYVMLNQLNILNANTYANLSTIADDPSFIVHQDLDDEESPRVNYNDLGADGVVTQVADQEAAPTHSGVVSFDKPTYKIADTVTVTLEDQDLNTDVDLIDIYASINATGDPADDTVGKTGQPVLGTGDKLGRLMDITFDDTTWASTRDSSGCDNTLPSGQRGLFDTGFTLIEQNGPASGLFRGDFQVPGQVCNDSTGALGAGKNTQGLDMEVNYLDFRDASGQIIEVNDGAGIRANTGSVSLDRTVYPVPWGSIDDFVTGGTSAVISGTTPNGNGIFPLHLTAITDQNPGTSNQISQAETLGDGSLTVHIQVNDPDFDTSASGEDVITQNVTSAAHGPVKVTVSRGNSQVLLAYAGGPTANTGLIDVDGDNTAYSSVRELGPITETTPSSGIFEFDLKVLYTDGPADTKCPATLNSGAGGFDSLASPGAKGLVGSRFDEATQSSSAKFCILQGDIITVQYTDPADASGNENTVTDSATFDLRNGALQSDKSVYIIGSDMILTLIEPDFDLDNDLAETYDLDLIEWDSDAATVTMGDLGDNTAAFDSEPSDLRETGDSTGIFQSVIEIPKALEGDNLERGEEIVLEYTDWGPSGADYVGQEDEDINLTVFTSNFGATVELDQKVYTWTDKVYITVVAPDHNFDSNLIDEIGGTSDPLKVSTRGHNLNNYGLVETGTDTGIFTGEVILTGFSHDVNNDGNNDAPNFTGRSASDTTSTGLGPTDGFLQADDDDGLTVAYEFSEDETVVGSALIRWNIGEVSWLEASYPASGTGVVRVIDPDMNLNPEAVDNFDVDVWSDSDAGGIDLTVTETNEATGIFEGTVFFTTTDDSSGHRLRVAEGDTVTAEYRDETLPDPYTTADELDISGTAFIGTVVPPLERAPASNARVVDAFGNTLDEVSVDQQVQITADLTNGQDREQPFAYLVQIQDENGVTVSLAWITGSLSAGQSFSPALSWIPASSGTYTATVFVWESVDNPTALSPPVSVDITVS